MSRRRDMSHVLTRNVRVGRIRAPLWTFVAALVLMTAAGQAVGPVLSGGLTGTAGVAVEQAVILDSESGSSTTVTDAEDFVVTTNDEGTAFTVAIEMHVGDSPTLELDLDNISDATANALLELNVPAGIDLDVEESGTAIDEAQLNRNSWLLQVTAGDTSDTLDITISPKDNLQPGFYTLTGRLTRVSN